MMKGYDRSVSLSRLLMMLVVVVGLSLQGCMEKGAVSIVCGNTGVAATPQTIPDEAGCATADGSGNTATGYKGINGPSPVPDHNPPYTCAAGSVITSTPGKSGCNLRNLSMKCTNTFTYPSAGTVGTCSWGCM